MDLTHTHLGQREHTSITRQGMLTLGAFVNPDIPHSPTSGGESTDVMFAFSMNGSLMMFTVKFFVALMLCAVSFMPDAALGLADTEIETRGGLCVTYRIMFERIFSNRSV